MKIAIIPARGGSKRIPKKNIKDFCGLPIIAYSINTAKKSNIFDKIIVSTDNDEIANVAKSYGAEVPFKRPEHLSDDHTGINDVIFHAVNYMIQKGQVLNEVCCIYATAPLIKINDLKESLKILQTNKWNYVISATNFNYPIHRSFEIKENGSIEMLFKKYYESRSQDIVKSMHDAGQFCWGYANTWLKKQIIFDNKSTIIELPNWRVQDIDTLDDWYRAEQIYKILKK